MRAVTLLGAACLLILGSSKKRPESPGRLIAEPNRPARRAPAPRARPTSRPYPACPAPSRTVRRAHLDVILARGPQVFLQGLDVDMVPWTALPPPAKRAWSSLRKPGAAGTFGGWRIRRFHPGDPCLGRTGLRPGDIIVSVNDQSLQRPGDLVRLWGALRTAPHLAVRMIREGQPFLVVVRISGAPPRRAPEPIDGARNR